MKIIKKILLVAVAIGVITVGYFATDFSERIYIKKHSTVDIKNTVDQHSTYTYIKLFTELGYPIEAIDYAITDLNNSEKFNPNFLLLGSEENIAMIESTNLDVTEKVNLIINSSGYNYITPQIRNKNYLEYYPELNEDSKFFSYLDELILKSYYIEGKLTQSTDSSNYAKNPFFLSTVVAGKTLFDQNVTFIDQAKKTSLTDQKVHYYRNEVNTLVVDNIIADYKKGSMTDLDAIMAYNEERKADGLSTWIAVSKAESMFHMFGETGSDHMKIQDADQQFEIVFNMKTGEIVSDDINFGTYNYGYSKGNLGHTSVDVNPFFLFANVYGQTLPSEKEFAAAYLKSNQPATELETELRNYFK